jgi:serine/threonine protein kinase
MDKYQRVKVLGKGSFGSAILIKRKTDGLLFVVKEVSLMKMSKKERDEARHECTVLQQLQHPNIVRYVEQFENKNNLYIVMEYCDGGDLAGKVKEARGPMKESSILYYFSQICLAMEYLHSRHILHRDIKTMNVFLMKNGAVKLGDFGISTVLRNTMGMANTVCGTPYYFSPELCRNRPYNNKSDIWALGVLLYECATGGRHPFDGTSMNQLMQRIVKGNYAPLSSQYSSDFRKMVDWCLQKEPARRPSIKQTLALPLMRRSLEQLEENLMLATQCRVRLKDIIDFESGMDQAESPKTPQSAQVSPRTGVGKDAGISPGQAAALALAQCPSAPPAATSSASPASSPYNGGAAAVVGPKPSAVPPPSSGGAAPNRAYDVHHFYNQYQRRPDVNPIVAGDRAGAANRAGAQTPPLQQPQQQQQQPRPPATADVSPRAQSPRSNVNLGYGNHNGNSKGLQSPSSGAAADPFHADMRRVDAIIAKYGRNTDEKAKETIHAYMRRKQEAYLKKQKEELESRERRNDLRQRELCRVLEKQRAAVSPTNANNNNHDRRSSPQSTDLVGGGAYSADHSPPRRLGSPQSRAKSEDASPRSRSPVSSPSRGRPAAAGAVFGRDPRRNGNGQPQPRSRPTTPQRQYAPPAQRASNGAAVSPKLVSNTPSRKVVYAANSPLPGQIDQRTGAASAGAAAEGRRETSSEQARPQSPSMQQGQQAEAFNADWRSLANPKPVSTPSHRQKKSVPAAGLAGGVGGHKMVLQPAHSPQVRRSQEALHPALVPRDGDDRLRRPSILVPLGNEAHDCQHSPRNRVPALSNNDLQGRGDHNPSGNAAVPESPSPRAAGVGDPRLQRPNRVHQGFLKPLDGRGDDHVSLAPSPVSGLGPRPDALPVPESHLSGASPSNSPRAQVARAKANVSNGRAASPPAELVDIPRSVATSAPPPSTTPAATGPVEEALRILRRRRQQTGASAAPPSSAEMKDLPALNLVLSEVGGAHRQHHRHHSCESAGYIGMSREAVSQDDQRFLVEEQQRRRKTEGNAVPNTLEVLRSLREVSDRTTAGGTMASDGAASGEVANPMGQLVLLKQRHRMQHIGAADSNGGNSAPSSVSHSDHDARPAARSDPSARAEKRPYTSRSSPPASAPAQITALSLGDVGRLAPRSASPSTSPKAGRPTSPSTSSGGAAAAAVGGAGGGGSQQSSMDGYAEMLQHLKDLLQRRRITRAASSRASTPTAVSPRATAAGAAAEAGNSPLHGGLQRRLPLPPPLDSLPSVAVDSSSLEAAVLSPPNLNATKPLYPPRPAPPVLEMLPCGDDPVDDDDDDFEDAVPLSPVRCAELNDTYTRLQQQKKGGRAVPDDVYTDDVDLTSANMEEELDGEEGYTGYYKLPSPQELLKSN